METKNWERRQIMWDLFFVFWFFVFFFFFITTLAAYGDSHARGLIRAVATGLYHSYSNAGFRAASVTYTTTHGNAGSLTH